MKNTGRTIAYDEKPRQRMPEDEIPATAVVYTIVGGKVAYTR